MGICGFELRHYVITPTLQKLGICSTAAEHLLLGTAAMQSDLGFHLQDARQIGLYGIDSDTHRRLWDEYLAFNADLVSLVRGFASQHEFLKAPDIELATNLTYATAIAWLLYQQAGIILPHTDDIPGLARCWYQVFGHKQPDRSTQDFIAQYHQLDTAEPCVAA